MVKKRWYKKPVVLGFTLFIALYVSYAVGYTSGETDQEQRITDMENTSKVYKDCNDKLWSLNDRMTTYYNGLLEWQNAGYQVDDYTAGNVNAYIDQWNADRTTYNTTCTTEAGFAAMQEAL